ncbi:hypothetical protein [Bacteriovorax sp. Seq25_V]|uniref:hypothetical protein n=1 Tax=Bacteriovorax sp. Seq25_V TaxID=1201288 RepID=UPI00038A2128|nr:hypothetical protein [Bacteriovorax sp. Seq25_V]EQC45621.1 hypothetical protein M900_2239 [Bacteriovorax sp. Seq25_V]
MRLLVLALLLSSCVKTYNISGGSSLADMDCQEKENCVSGMPFKYLAPSTEENIDMIEKASKKYEVVIITKNENYLHLKKNQIHLEFFADPQTKEVLVKGQLEQKKLLGNDSPEKLIEKIRFDFFQKNF